MRRIALIAVCCVVVATPMFAQFVVIDPANVPSTIEPDVQQNFDRWNICSGAGNSKGSDANCSIVLKYGMKRDFNRWLSTLGLSAPVKSLTELREWNLKHERAGAIKYGQSNLDISDEIDVQADRARYEADRAKDIALAATHGIDEVMHANRLDALLFPGSNGSALAARPGYPSIIVPFAMVPNAAPSTKMTSRRSEQNSMLTSRHFAVISPRSSFSQLLG